MSGDADGSAVERWEAVAALCTGVAHPIRVAIVESLHQAGDRPLTEVADQFKVSRSAVQKHVARLEETDLVYRPEREGQTYALTPFGRLFAVFLKEHGDMVVQALRRVEAAEAEAAAEFEDVPLGNAVREKAVTSRKWELVSAEVLEMLEEFPEFGGIGEEDTEE